MPPRFNFAFGITAVVAVLIAVSSVMIVRFSYRALVEQKQQDELVMAKNIAIQVEEVLSKARNAVEALSRMPSIQSMDSDRQVDALTIVTQTTELIDGIVITDPRGNIRAVDAEINTERIMPAADGEANYGKFARAVAGARSSRISDVYLSKTGEICVAINTPIRRNGRFVGMVSGGILLREHSMGGIDNIRIGKNGYAYVVDASGDVIIHPQSEQILEDFSGNPAVRALLTTREPGVIEFENREGILVAAAFSPVEETGWGVVVRQPATESYAFADQIRTMLWILLGVSVALSLGLGFFLARQQKAAENAIHLARSEKLAAVGQLAAGLAHEINNPIGVILGFSDLLLKKIPTDHPQRHYVEEIDREAARCRKLIETLLNFSRQTALRTQPCDVNRIAEETLNLVKDQSEKAGIQIVYRRDDRLPIVDADADQLRQVILNLLLNACQAMPGGGRLEVATRDVPSNGHIEVTVSDTGGGIPSDQRDLIFSPFFTTKENGTGLGLAVSYSIMERHGGRIEVDSPKGGGAIFTLKLPKRGTHGEA